MEEWEQSLLDETRFEVNRLNALNDYMTSPKFSESEREIKDLLYDEVRVRNTLVQIMGKKLEMNNLKFTRKGEL